MLLILNEVARTNDIGCMMRLLALHLFNLTKPYLTDPCAPSSAQPERKGQISFIAWCIVPDLSQICLLCFV